MKLLKLFKLISCFYLPILVFLTNHIVTIPLGIYSRFGWFDIPMHFIGGCAIAYSLILVLRKCNKEIIIKDRFLEIVLIVSFVALIAVFWEFYEFILDIILNHGANDLKDTLLDILIGLSGGFIVALFKKRVTPTK